MLDQGAPVEMAMMANTSKNGDGRRHPPAAIAMDK
jgi:hypothetical protein